MDYQNVHLTGAKLFAPRQPLHEFLVHPMHYANQLIRVRNSKQRADGREAALTRVLVYRGLPSATHDPDAYAWNMANKSSWERSEQVNVTHRPLKYEYEWTADGRRATDVHGREIVKGKREKGIDVLCALAVVREAAAADVDLVVLASQDTDLEPALDEACRLGHAKIETASWFSPGNYGASREIRMLSGLRLWNTRLGIEAFMRTIDRTTY